MQVGNNNSNSPEYATNNNGAGSSSQKAMHAGVEALAHMKQAQMPAAGSGSNLRQLTAIAAIAEDRTPDQFAATGSRKRAQPERFGSPQSGTAPLPPRKKIAYGGSLSPSEYFLNGAVLDSLMNPSNPEANDGEAAKCYQKAADKKHPQALLRLGVFHELGKGNCNGGVKKAADLYKQAGELGLPEGYNNLGLLHKSGVLDEDDPNEKQAVEMFQLAIQTGICPDAHLNLAIAYENGEGIAKDLDKAREHTRLAAEGGDSVAQFNLGVQYEEGIGKDATKYIEGISQDYRMAAYWYDRALQNPVNENKHWAQFALANLCLKGHLSGISNATVLKLLDEASKTGSAKAIFALVDIHFKGLLGQEVNFSKALSLLDKVKKRKKIQKYLEKFEKDVTDQNLLVVMAKHLAKKGNEKALSLYEKAANLGSEQAKRELPICLYQMGVALTDKKEVRGLELLHQAAKQGNQQAIDKISEVARKALEKKSQ